MRPCLGIVCLALSLGVVRGHAQSPTDIETMKRQIDRLVVGQEAMERQLQEIRALLQSQRPPTPAQLDLSVEGAPATGNPAARLTLIEFSDYECPFCTRYTRETLPQLVADYVKTGKVRYVFRNFPLETMHPLAMRASQAALCAGDKGKYWEMHDLLFANSPAIGPTALVDYAKRLGLESTAFLTCLNSGRHLARVRQDIAEGKQAGVTGTPTFFLGRTPAAGGKLRPVNMLSGAQPYSTFKQAIDLAMQAKP